MTAQTLERPHEPGGPVGLVEPGALTVVEATAPADVRAAVNLAIDRGLPFAVEGTGHGTLARPESGVLLKTGLMDQVRIDPVRQVAEVGPGARWSQVIEAAAPYGLAPLSGNTPSVGVAGFTLGGGVGWLAREYGFAADSLLRADVVTADGQSRVASAAENPDLFWALRGAGANFGVVTSLEFRLYPAAIVYGGTATFPASRAADVLAFFRNWEQPSSLTVFLVVTPDALVVRGVYAGSAADGERALRPLWRVAGASLANEFRVMPYADVATIGGTAPHAFELYDDLPDDLIGTLSDPDAGFNAVEVRRWGGAMAAPSPVSGAAPGPVGHRDVPFSLTIDGPAEVASRLRTHSTGGSFLNFLHDRTRTADAYTPWNHTLLRELKRVYDPANRFGLSHNIPPA
ncbi:FAD-binding oxidoreductase [Flindersiella endophytica]